MSINRDDALACESDHMVTGGDADKLEQNVQ